MGFIEKIIRDEHEPENIIDEIKNDNLPIILWGCGDVAGRVYTYLINNNIVISGVFVDKPFFQNQIFHGINVCSIEEICNKYKQFNVIACFNPVTTRLQRLKLGVKNVNKIYSIDFCLLYHLEPIDFEYIVKNKKLFEWTFYQLSDELSEQSFIAYLNAKIRKSSKDMTPYVYEITYFCEDIIKLTSDEVFIDCGAYNGDTIRSFIKNLKNRSIKSYKNIYAFEPDEQNYSQLLYMSKEIQNLHCLKKGVWSEQSVLRFNSGDATGSAISNDGDVVIEVDSIDNILKGQKATFIKMDIEGAELNALKGAEKTIKKHKPKLAICVYHKADDLITIPQYIKSLVPEYKLYFRLHQIGTIDSVLYAVCDE